MTALAEVQPTTKAYDFGEQGIRGFAEGWDRLVPLTLEIALLDRIATLSQMATTFLGKLPSSSKSYISG